MLGGSHDWEIAHNDCSDENYIYVIELDRFDTPGAILALTMHAASLARWNRIKWVTALRRIGGLNLLV
jgi:hypothetical protein